MCEKDIQSSKSFKLKKTVYLMLLEDVRSGTKPRKIHKFC